MQQCTKGIDIISTENHHPVRGLPAWLRLLKQARLRCELSTTSASGELNISVSILSKIEHARRSLEMNLFEKMCSIYGVLPWALLDGRIEAGEFTLPSASAGARLQRIRHSKGRNIVTLAEHVRVSPACISLIENDKRRVDVTFGKRYLDALHVPYISFFSDSSATMLRIKPIAGRVAAGLPVEMELDPESDLLGTMIFPDDSGKNLFSLEIFGNSMEPYYLEGDVVFCRTDIAPRNGGIAVVRLADGETLCKVFHRGERKIRLVSINTAYSPIEIEPDDLVAAWPVVGSYRKEKG